MSQSQRPLIAPWVWPVVGVVALVGAAIARYMQADAKPTATAKPTSASAATGADADTDAIGRQAAEEIRQHLIASGWSREAATEVTELNQSFFGVLVAEDPSQTDRLAKTLGRLGDHPGLMQLIRRRPETAGLLAASRDPQTMAGTLRLDRRYDAVSNVYSRHGADGDAVAAALNRHGALICHLIDEGMLGAETVFVFPRDAGGDAGGSRMEAVEAYDQWLASAFESSMTDENQLAAMFQLVMIQGDALRREMIDNETFRRQFPAQTWPRFERLVDEGVLPLELAALDMNLFHLLALPPGERLVRRWGMLPLELLYGDNAFPPALHKSLIETMMAGDNTTLSSLVQFGQEPLLAELLSREDASAEVKAAAMARLHAAGANYPELLRRYSELSTDALADEVGPPPSGPITWLPLYYTVYEVPKKILQGRNPTMMDAVIAVLDPVFLFAGPLGPDDAIKVAGQQSIKTAGQKGATTTATNTLKTAARQQAARQMGARAAAKVGATESAPWLVSQAIRGSRAAVQRKVQSAVTVDITGPTRLLLKVTGVGRKSFKQLTGLEARMFMRPDRRVLVRLDKLLINHPAGRFLADTAVAGMVETGIEIPVIENAAVGVARSATEFPERVNQTKQRFSAWQKNMAAWWLSQATGMWEHLN